MRYQPCSSAVIKCPSFRRKWRPRSEFHNKIFTTSMIYDNLFKTRRRLDTIWFGFDRRFVLAKRFTVTRWILAIPRKPSLDTKTPLHESSTNRMFSPVVIQVPKFEIRWRWDWRWPVGTPIKPASEMISRVALSTGLTDEEQEIASRESGAPRSSFCTSSAQKDAQHEDRYKGHFGTNGRLFRLSNILKFRHEFLQLWNFGSLGALLQLFLIKRLWLLLPEIWLVCRAIFYDSVVRKGGSIFPTKGRNRWRSNAISLKPRTSQRWSLINKRHPSYPPPTTSTSLD